MGCVLQENSRIHHLLPSSSRALLGTACSWSHQPSQEGIFSLWEIHCHCACSQTDLTLPNNCSCSAQTTLPMARAGAEGELSTHPIWPHCWSIPNHQEAEDQPEQASLQVIRINAVRTLVGQSQSQQLKCPQHTQCHCLIIATQGGQTLHGWIGTTSPNWQLVTAGCAILHG